MRSTKSAAVRKGPAAALEVLYRAEYSGMVRLAYTLVGNNAEAEEVVQDAFVTISPRVEHLDQPGAYLRTTVVNGCKSILRRRRLTKQVGTVQRPDLAPEGDAVWDLMDKLPEHQRIAVVLRYYCGCRASEIAEIIDQPAATVRSHLRRALASMREEITS
jgi:RNA polymerase sigma factor (sigma-70 family)